MRLGIDFGTTRTVVASVENGNYPVCTFSWEGAFKEFLPTLVAVKRGALKFGWEAVSCLNDPDTHVLRSMKRLTSDIQPNEPVELASDLSISMLELVTLFLRYVRRMLSRNSNLTIADRRPLEVMVAVPANANNNQRYITLEAFRGAGFSVLGMMNEPSAAAIEFAHRYMKDLGPRSPKNYVVAYDLGGGTFDVAAVGLSGLSYDVVTNEGIARLGGDDFDRVILEMVLEELGSPPKTLDRSLEARLLEECRERKEGLKPNTRKMVVDPGPVFDDETTVVLETERIYARCGTLIQNTVDAVHAALRNLSRAKHDYGDPKNLAAIYLVGGSVSFPPVLRALRALFGRKVRISPFPHAATAIGLALAANPERQIRLRESVSRNFGVWREHEGGRRKVFDPIFGKDSQLDWEVGRLKAIRSYHPVHNVGHLRFLECSSIGEVGEPQGDITLWRDIFFPYDPELKDHQNLSRIKVEEQPDLLQQEVIETYSYDGKGMIHAEIENRTSGYRRIFKLGTESKVS